MVGEKVPLKVSLMNGIMRFGKKGKLSPRFVCPFEVLRRARKVAYKLGLPPSLSGVHPVFHMSMLRRYLADSSHDLDYSTVQLDESLGYEEEPVVIVDRQVRFEVQEYFCGKGPVEGSTNRGSDLGGRGGHE
ncbi:PREDICTED: uncharacterized protein LOC109210946 [Nicotiana attenuata]|uniref:uncharacterized protein LOC109210946 n=1 Tax=Nicotiana attenuata TaxID=49451 RepID=UPI000905735F|nr:PREDICTED: uncharacterized protein LOC109210946 [Nicotiana attenuata]